MDQFEYFWRTQYVERLLLEPESGLGFEMHPLAGAKDICFTDNPTSVHVTGFIFLTIYNLGVNQKTVKSITSICLLIAAVGVFTLMLKNPQDNFLNIPIFVAIMIAIALRNLKLKN